MLRPAAVRGTMTFMDPRWAALSPAVGAASAGGDAVLANLYRLGGPCAPGLAPFPAACALARALYYATDGGASRPAPARTRSRPGYYLDHGALGALVAQARDGAPEDDARALSRLGAATNAFRGERTGVSFRRWEALVATARAAAASPSGASLLARYAWETASSRRDLLAFGGGLGGLKGGLEGDAAERAAWAASTFDEADFLDPRRVDAAAANVALPENYEVVAAHANALAGLKGPRRAETRNHGDARPRPDCVEVCVREVCDLALYDPATRTFAVDRLPEDAPAAPFYRAGGDDGDAFFSLCQGIAGCGYLSATPAGAPYELEATLATVARAAAALLGVGTDVSTLDALAAAWNADPSRPRLDVDVSRSGRAGGDRYRQIADLRLAGAGATLELLLEEAPPVALAFTARRDDAAAAGARSSLAAAVARAGGAPSPIVALAQPMLGDALLDALDGGASPILGDAVLAARLYRDDARLWAPASERADRRSRGEDAATAEAARRRRVVRAFGAACAGGREDLLPLILGAADALSARDLAGARGVGRPAPSSLARRPDVAAALASPDLRLRLRRLLFS